ncbi:DUF6274 family protein [Streptomyces sp. NPDC050856]|uniref:DUF6274 family protein n=1 Tax=Streptomyces sp. NPDC050856 TaxID=3154939 RepID=UPI0033E5BFFE
MTASTVRHETRALLRAHLAAASGYRHLTRHCPVCHRLLRLAMELPEEAAGTRRGGVTEGVCGSPEPGGTERGVTEEAPVTGDGRPDSV